MAFRKDGERVLVEVIEDGVVFWSRPSTLPWKRAVGIRAYGVTALDEAHRYFA